MRRRTALASLGAIGATSLGGCTTIFDRSVRLASPTAEETDGQTSLRYRRDGESFASVDIVHDQATGEPTDENHAAMRFSIWHHGSTDLASLSLTLRPDVPPETVSLPTVWLKRSSSTLFPEVQFHDTRDGDGVLFEVPEFGEYGRGAVSFVLAVRPRTPTDDLTLNLDLDFVLSGLGVLAPTYTGSGDTSITLSY